MHFVFLFFLLEKIGKAKVKGASIYRKNDGGLLAWLSL